MGFFSWLLLPRCPSCGRKCLEGYLDKVVVEGFRDGLRVNPEWLWRRCSHCGAMFRERHYGDGQLEEVTAEEWSKNVAGDG